MYSVVLLIEGRLDADCQSFAPIGLHEIKAASDWMLIKRHCIGMKGLQGVTCHPKIGGASEEFKNQPAALLKAYSSVNFVSKFLKSIS
jgi:hypothetical protein